MNQNGEQVDPPDKARALAEEPMHNAEEILPGGHHCLCRGFKRQACIDMRNVVQDGLQLTQDVHIY